MSNVCPIIPHEIIETELIKRNIKATSRISFLRAGINDSGSSHIMSFLRQAYIHNDDINKLPEAIPIQCDDTTYWIYFSADNIICFMCKQDGHIARQCPKHDTSATEASAGNEEVVGTCPREFQTSTIDFSTNVYYTAR